MVARPLRKPSILSVPQYIGVEASMVVTLFDFKKVIEHFFNTWGLTAHVRRGYQRPQSTWGVEENRAYLDHLFAGGYYGRDFFFNAPGYTRGRCISPMMLVDGFMRFNAVDAFLDSKLSLNSGLMYPDFEATSFKQVKLTFWINDLESMSDTYRWYLQLNRLGPIRDKQHEEYVRSCIEPNDGDQYRNYQLIP